MDMIELRLSAAVAPYLDAIAEKRKAGWRWRDIRDALNLSCSDRTLAQAVRRCIWKAPQIALPDPSPKTVAKPEVVQRKREDASAITDRPLPTVPGRMPSSEEEVQAMLMEKRGLKF